MLLPLLATATALALNVGVLWLALCLVAFPCAVTVGATVLPPMRTIVNRLNRFGDFRFRIPDA